MKKDKITNTNRNWALVFISSVLLLIGVALLAFAVINITSIGWLSLLAGLTGATTIFASIMSIVKNDASWILLGLIIPG